MTPSRALAYPHTHLTPFAGVFRTPFSCGLEPVPRWWTLLAVTLLVLVPTAHLEAVAHVGQAFAVVVAVLLVATGPYPRT